MKSAKQSRFLNHGDWRIPTKGETELVIGKHADCKNNDPKKGEYAVSHMISHSIGIDNSAGMFWSSTNYVGGVHSNDAFGISFSSGLVVDRSRGATIVMRLVRAGQSLGGAFEFQREYVQRVVSHFANSEKQLATTLGFSGFGELENVILQMQEATYPAVSWKATPQTTTEASELQYGNLISPNGYVLAKLAGLVKGEQKINSEIPASAPAAPRSFASRKPQLSKGEFENTAQLTARQAAADATAQADFDRDQRAFEASKRDYAAVVKQQADAQARAVADSNDPEKYKALVAKNLPQAVALALGNPVLSDITYDADKQVFNAILKSSRGAFSQPVTVAASQTEAPKLKQDLLSQKIAPIVTLQLPSLAATWALQENVVLRTERFAQANNSARRLLELIAEYPNSAEASAAKVRIPSAQRESYDVAVRSNSSNAYQSFISDFAGTDTQKLLPLAEKAKQVAAQREERERIARAEQDRRDSAARDAQERERIANACNAYYPGRKVGFKPAGILYFGNTLDAVVIGKGNGAISIRIVDTSYKTDYGRTLEVPCTSDQLR